MVFILCLLCYLSDTSESTAQGWVQGRLFGILAPDTKPGDSVMGVSRLFGILAPDTKPGDSVMGVKCRVDAGLESLTASSYAARRPGPGAFIV